MRWARVLLASNEDLLMLNVEELQKGQVVSA
jgi:hypothetical protein